MKRKEIKSSNQADLLPNELWNEIFTFFTRPQDFNSIRLVCRRFNDLSMQRLLSLNTPIKSELPVFKRNYSVLLISENELAVCGNDKIVILEVDTLPSLKITKEIDLYHNQHLLKKINNDLLMTADSCGKIYFCNLSTRKLQSTFLPSCISEYDLAVPVICLNNNNLLTLKFLAEENTYTFILYDYVKNTEISLKSFVMPNFSTFSPTKAVEHLESSINKKWLAVSFEEANIIDIYQLTDMTSPQHYLTLEAKSSIEEIKFLNNDTIACVSQTHIQIWDINGKLLNEAQVVSYAKETVWNAFFSIDNRYLAILTKDEEKHQVFIWNLKKFEKIFHHHLSNDFKTPLQNIFFAKGKLIIVDSVAIAVFELVNPAILQKREEDNAIAPKKFQKNK